MNMKPENITIIAFVCGCMVAGLIGYGIGSTEGKKSAAAQTYSLTTVDLSCAMMRKSPQWEKIASMSYISWAKEPDGSCDFSKTKYVINRMKEDSDKP